MVIGVGGAYYDFPWVSTSPVKYHFCTLGCVIYLPAHGDAILVWLCLFSFLLLSWVAQKTLQGQKGRPYLVGLHRWSWKDWIFCKVDGLMWGVWTVTSLEPNHLRPFNNHLLPGTMRRILWKVQTEPRFLSSDSTKSPFSNPAYRM